MTLYVGTSGWAYREWKPAFYPRGLSQSRFLEHYASVLSACEINATFYRLQKPETLARWAAATPDDFRFSVKAHRGVTHSKEVAPDEGRIRLLAAFFESLAPLRDKLGVVLFQFPPYRRRDDDGLAALMRALPGAVACAFEFRHASWAVPEVAEMVRERGALCLSSTDGSVPGALPPGAAGYVRLRTDRYSPEARTGWRDLLVSEGKGRDVYAFAKHEGIAAGDPFGGVGLATWLAAQTAGPRREAS